MARLPVGTAILGRYVLTRAIGQGGVSTVYSAVDARRGRLLAVKIFAPSDDGPAAGDDVRREALITDRLRHPSVPRVFEYGAAPLHDGTVMPYVVLELLSGVPLTERLAWGPLNWPEAVRIAATAADVLAVAHRRGVVHRDLSARNVMVTPHGIKIIDFGLATAAQAGLAAAAHPGLATAAHPGLATAVHPGMATAGHLGLADAGHPGLAAAEHPVTAGRTRPPSHPKTAFARPADDVYTLGVLLYEMVTGRSPYPPRTAGTIRMAGRVARLAPTPVMAVPGLPAEVRDLVRACMAKVPEHRPESARVALSLWSILERARVRTPEPSISR